MKLSWQQMAEAAARREAEADRQLNEKFADHPDADFFNLGAGKRSVGTFIHGLRERGLQDPAVIERLTQAMLDGSLHKLQAVRISRLLNDPSDELEPEDRELLIAQVLDLEWPKEMAAKN